MADLVSLPAPLSAAGEVFLDARTEARALRVRWHHEAGIVVLSRWYGATCAETFRLRQSDLPAC